MTGPDSPSSGRWHWAGLAGGLGPLQAASFIEWRYYAVLSRAFHGIVGLALVNPHDRFRTIAESGLLVIVAGVLDRVDPGADAAQAPAAAQLCWMHLFPMAACCFDAGGPGSLTAGDPDCCIALNHTGAGAADIHIEAGAGLVLKLAHVGLAGAAIAPVTGRDFSGPLGSGRFGARWTVHCPSPVAVADGSLRLDNSLLTPLAAAPGSSPGYATPALRAAVAAGHNHWSWHGAAGYYEHSWGVRPLPLHGWDFLFVPDVGQGQAMVLQTYRGSRALRYVDLCWRHDDTMRHQRFGADGLRLDWTETVDDPVLGVRRPLARRILAEADGLHLEVHNRILQRVPLLRRQRLAVRHFFIDEEIGVANWQLTDAAGNALATSTNQPCGGELAHFRLRTPRL